MAEYNNQRFYWIKLTDRFMTSDTVDFLMEQKDGANYVVLYQMLCLKTVNNDGQLSRTIGEVIIPYEEEKIQRDMKWFSIDTIRVALNLYQKLGLIYRQENGMLKIANFENLIGSQTISAFKKQEQLKNRGGNLGGQKVEFFPPEKDKEKDKDIIKERMKENKEIKEIENNNARETYQSIMDDMCLEQSVRPTMWAFIKHCQLNGKTLTNDKLTNILVEMDLQNLTAEEKNKVLLDAINGGYFDIRRKQ